MKTLWAKMSMRERGLAVVVVVMLGCGLSYILVASALDHLERQEHEIDRLEQQLINYSRQMERRPKVDAAFARIAAQHSSEWSGEEIYDRLGSEIYRLARQNPGEPGSPGEGPEIVPIPQLPPGELERNPDGYRSYVMEFQTGETAINHIATFLRRLEESPQALRIEELQIQRAPDRLGTARATIRVNRTVVDGVEEAVEPPPFLDDSPANMLPVMAASPQSSFEGFEGGALDGWDAQGCELSPATDFVTDGSVSLKVEWSEQGARLAQPLQLMGGQDYTMTVDVMTNAPLAIAVVDQQSGQAYDGAVTVAADGALRSYTMRFTVSGRGVRQMLAPRFAFEGAEGQAVIDRVRIRPYTGAK